MTENGALVTTQRTHLAVAHNLRVVLGLLASAALLSTGLLWVGATPAVAHTPHDAVADIALSPQFSSDRTAYTIVREYLLKSTDGGDTWKRLNRGLDNKRNLSAIEVSATDPNLLYAASRGDGAYKSTDGGASWVEIDTGLGTRLNIALLVLSPHDNDVVFAVTPDGEVMKTTSGGAAWRLVDQLKGQNVDTLAFAPGDPSLVFAGGQRGLLQSTDLGERWKETTTGDRVNAIAVSPEYPKDRTLFVATAAKGVLKSTDGAKSFADASGGLSDKRVLGLQISSRFGSDSQLLASTWKDGVFRTGDAGGTWKRKAEGLTTDSQADLLKRSNFTAVVSSAADGEATPTVFLAGFNGLFRSTDDADSWQEITTQDATNIGAIALSPDYAADGTIAISTYINGAFRSDDRGKTWTAINKGLTAKVEYLRRDDYFNRLTGIFFSPSYPRDQMMFAGSRGYFYDSENKGALWHPTTPPGVVLPDDFPPGYFIPAFSPDFAKDKTIFAGTDTGLVFRSQNGKTLKKVARIKPEIVALVVSPDYASDRLVLAATVAGVYRSTDRGESWKPIAGTPKGILSLSISAGFATDQMAFIGTKNGLLVTKNGGTSWKPILGLPFGDQAYIEAVVTSPDFAKDKTALVSVRGRGLFRSTDGAKTFTAVGQTLLDDNVVLSSFYHPTTEPIVFSPDFATDQTVYGMAESTVYRSTDAGQNWSALKLPRTTHELTEASAPNELLLTPRAGDPVEKTKGGVTTASRTAADHTVLVLSKKRVAGAVVVAAVGLALLWLVKLGSRSSQKRLAIYLRVACSGLIFAVALFFLTNR